MLAEANAILVQSYPPNEPVIAEANVILWPIQIAKGEDFKDIIVEGDAKIYFDVLNGSVAESLWSISSLLDNLFPLACLIGFLEK
jgi:hypothetical protein